uniref:Tail protein n=1 Tax=Dulem virus 36 TaxID=3145754 RepID=A0AAU8B0H3_9CAUD
MSISAEITRIQGARDTIRTKLVTMGMALETDKLPALATAIDSMVDNGAVSVNVQEGETYTIPAGYHNGSGTVSGVSGGGNYTLQDKTVTPTKSQQSIAPDQGYYGLSSVTVGAIPAAYQNVSSVTAGAADVLAGKSIVNASGATVAGTMPNNGPTTAGSVKTLDATADNQSYTIPKGYHNGTGTVDIVLETKSVTPTKDARTITPTAGKVLSSVNIAAIPSNYITTTDATAIAADILSGKTAYVSGSKITGSMVNNGAISATIDGLTDLTSSYTVPAGYTSGGTVSLTDDIETQLAAI